MRRRGCPYHFCSAVVLVVNVGEASDIIREHSIVHPMLTGRCPASLMRLPMDMHTYTHLNETWYNIHVREIARAEDYQRRNPPSGRRNESQSLRGPHRMGREPEPDHPDWALGGREDEDVRSEAEDVTGTVPQGVVGYNLGAGMASITELAGMAHAAMGEAGGADYQLNQVYDSLQRARQAYAGILGESTSERITAATNALQRAQELVLDAKTQIAAQEEKGQEFINGLYA